MATPTSSREPPCTCEPLPRPRYGATFTGDAEAELGAVFKMAPNGKVTTLHAFSKFKDGYRLGDAPVLALDGSLLGTCYYGGVRWGEYNHGMGTVYRIVPARAGER